MIRGLVECVALHPVDSGFEVELVGEIASMVALAAGSDPRNGKAALGGEAVADGFRRSVKVVAGVGFEPTTFRL